VQNGFFESTPPINQCFTEDELLSTPRRVGIQPGIVSKIGSETRNAKVCCIVQGCSGETNYHRSLRKMGKVIAVTPRNDRPIQEKSGGREHLADTLNEHANF